LSWREEFHGTADRQEDVREARGSTRGCVMTKMVAIVDDEPDILELVSLHLERANFRVKGFEDAASFFQFLKEETPDLLILDLMLPDADGFEICKCIKKDENFSSMPIVMLTAKAEETDKVLGLELGADDYVTKPFSPKELVARIKAVLRRQGEEGQTRKIRVGDLLDVDLEKYQVTVKGEPISLTPTEFRILKLLSSKKGWVFSRDQILDYLWGNEKVVLDRTVDVHIRNLRGKLGPARRYIKNVRGIGYKLEE
jgi:two-component system phosphate regulon response regulator PhoB/two-component system alkaline phosphatase synthesis response regulator PhoP